MALQVIGAGLGRTATFSLKFALEHIGFGPCHHMLEVMAGARQQIPLWIEVGKGQPDWDTIFTGFRSSSDYPACSHWRALAEFYPQAKVVLTIRSADSWFESVSETIFSQRMQGSLAGTPAQEMMELNAMAVFGDRVTDRAFMTDWYERYNQEIIDTLPAERLLVFHPKEGWEPLCRLLGVAVPPEPFPRINRRDELGAASDELGGLPPDPEALEAFGRAYINQLRATAFAA